MHQLRIAIRKIFFKFKDKEESQHPVIKMSDIKDVSVTSHISSPFYSSTLLPKSNDVAHSLTNNEQSDYRRRTVNNVRTISEDSKLVKDNNDNIKAMSNDAYSPRSQYKHENKPLKLKVVIRNADQQGRVMNVHDDLSKTQSPVAERNSIDFVRNEKEPVGKAYGNKPVMGRNALIKKANVELNDSFIVYDLVTEKYNGIINHYLDRSSRRRRLRTESPDSCSDTVYSSPPAYSPLTISSISTSGSCGPDERTGFRFPVTSYPSPVSDFMSGVSSSDVKMEFSGRGNLDLSNSEVSDKNDFRFIASTDETNIETSAEDFDSSTISTCKSEQCSTSFSDYDPIKFLDNALGDLTNVSIAHEVPSEMSDKIKVLGQKNDDRSIGTSNLSTLLSRSSSLYISGTPRNIYRSCSIRSLGQLSEIPENHRPSSNSDESYLQQLMKDLSLQNEVMFQISKALNYCRSTKKFESSTALLEAEKILLVASCTKEALTKEIQNLDDDLYEKQKEGKCYGEVTLSHLTFHLKDCPKSDSHRDFTEYFLIILTCGRIVLASEIVTVDDKGELQIERSFTFPNLAPHFEISVCIYAMRVGNKQHSNQEPGKIKCPSPKTMFSHLRKGLKKHKVLSDVVYLKPSSFTLWGRRDIRSRHLPKGKNDNITLTMLNMPLSSSLSHTFSVKIATNVELTNKISEFLTVGTDNDQGCTIWNRRWCVLEGFLLRYWNYPSEEVCNPLATINLSKCVEQQICVADRTICARPKTLMLPIRQKDSVKKYFLSADNCSSMEQWKTEINNVVCSLRMWNCIDIE